MSNKIGLWVKKALTIKYDAFLTLKYFKKLRRTNQQFLKNIFRNKPLKILVIDFLERSLLDETCEDEVWHALNRYEKVIQFMKLLCFVDYRQEMDV